MESASSFIIEIWMRMILMVILMKITTILMVIIMTKPYDYDDDTDDDNPPPRFCATAWLGGPEFCVLSSVLEFWLMVYGFFFE